MTFLHTIFLPALLAAAIPLLLHLLSKRRLKVIPFSSLEFLKQLQKKKSRRIQVRQLLLLLIRTLAILAVVFVFARPALKSSQAAGSAAAVEIVLVVDNGLNMATETRDGQLLYLAARKAMQVLELVNPNDQVNLLFTSEPWRVWTASPGNLEVIREKLTNAAPVNYPPNLREIGPELDRLFEASSRFNREVYFISSFYSSEWDSLELGEKGETERRFLLPVGPASRENIALRDVKISNTILQKNRPVDVSVSISNYSERKIESGLLSIYHQGNRIAQSSTDIAAGGSVVESFTILPDTVGSQPYHIKWEDIDPLTIDNRRWFVLDIPDSINVYAVVNDPGTRKLLSAVFAGKEASYIHLEWQDHNRWEAESFSGFDVILLAGVPSVSPGTAERLQEFVSAGGGLILFQSPEADLVSLSRGLWQDLGFNDARGVLSGQLGWGQLDLKHPLFEGVFDDKANPRSPYFTFAIDVITGTEDKIVIPFSNGSPFLIERNHGRGKILMYTGSLGLDGGDFIYSGIFAPLMLRSVGYSAGGSGSSGNQWTTGNSYKPVLSIGQVTNLQLELPDDNRINIPPRPVLGGLEIDAGKIESPGIYTVYSTNRVVGRYAANIPTTQSDLQRSDLEHLSEQLGEALTVSGDEEDITEMIYSLRFGKELWQPLAAAFMVLLIAESILGKAWRRKNT